MNQSDLSANQGMLFEVNVLIIYEKYSVVICLRKEENYNSPHSLLSKGKTNAKKVP